MPASIVEPNQFQYYKDKNMKSYVWNDIVQEMIEKIMKRSVE